MGKAAATAETMTKKRKKKGRPSLLDLQKRALKQEQQQQQLLQQKNPPPQPKNRNQNPPRQNPNSPLDSRRSARRNPHSGGDEDDGDADDDDDDDERKEKKHKLLLGLNSQQQQLNPLFRSNSSASNSYGSGSDNPEAAALAIVPHRQIGGGSDETGEKLWKATDTLHGLSGEEPGPTTTPLPDKKLLVFILDRLQKKDTYGVFSDPVDTEELPDYLDIIDHPMDFSTVRKKLDGGEYSSLEQFEGDIFLICSNAMQYNSSDTVYYRQARSIQELAKKDFENLRQDSDDGEPEEPKVEKVVRRGRPPGSGKSKKLLEKPPHDRLAIEFSSDATLATGGDNSIGSNGYNLRKTTLFKQPSDAVLRITNGPHNGDTHASWQNEWENEFPASVVKAVMKHSKKTYTVDENRRDSYNPPSASVQEPTVLNSFDGELKQLVAVGLSAEYGYARSLARFAAGLGPTAWRVASKKIQHVLPMGVEFGPGWVGENDLVQSGHVLSNDTASGDPSNSHQPPSTSTSTTPPTNMHQTWNRDDTSARSGSVGPSTSFNDGITPTMKPMAPPPVQQQQIRGGGSPFDCSTSQQVGPLPTTPYRPFGVVPTSYTSFGSIQQGHPAFDPNKGKPEILSSGKDSSSAPGISRTITPATPGFAGRTPTGPQGLPPAPPFHNQQELFQFPTDLNVGFLSPGSPSSSGVVPIGSPRQQPDLALQL